MLMQSDEDRLSKYFAYAEKTMSRISVKASGELKSRVEWLIDNARRYYEDAKHYMALKDYSTSYVCIAYCEGLLDALRLLGLVEVQN
ncbi:MAG: DUF357 domain-containing protein [Candidatus Nezhaarchaeota archaeon]|nr:DUF357 domain-containing protein [Candidatus Nezhaarchaeota archaeon]